jgi:hypothetical protein
MTAPETQPTHHLQATPVIMAGAQFGSRAVVVVVSTGALTAIPSAIPSVPKGETTRGCGNRGDSIGQQSRPMLQWASRDCGLR